MRKMMDYWQAIRNEFLNRYAREYDFSYTNLRFYPVNELSQPIKKERQIYPFNEDGSLYLTQREAECVYFLHLGFTIKGTATELLLSARTVEFYLKRIKEKFRMPNKKSLLSHLASSPYFDSFFQSLDQEFNA